MKYFSSFASLAVIGATAALISAAPVPSTGSDVETSLLQRDVHSIDLLVFDRRIIKPSDVKLDPKHDFGKKPDPKEVEAAQKCVADHCNSILPDANWATIKNKQHEHPDDHVTYYAGKDDQTYLRQKDDQGNQKPNTPPGASMPTSDIATETKIQRTPKGKPIPGPDGKPLTEEVPRPPLQHAPFTSSE